ncbi:MAG: HigA family addiction module antitoxin [Bacillus subtilis]|nr:HigA family addiction module antitoxin [Bacillus subtilis]
MTNSNYVEYKNEITFHPGYFVKEWIEQEEMSQEEFAHRVNMTPKTLSKLVNGLTPLTTEMANAFAAVTGTSIDLWQNLQSRYDAALIRIHARKELEEDIALIDQSICKFFSAIQVIPMKMNVEDVVVKLRGFFRQARLSNLVAPSAMVNYRADAIGKAEMNPLLVNLWVETMVIEAKDILTQPFSLHRIEEALSTIRAMTRRRSSGIFEPLRSLLQSCGVAFVVLPYLSKSHIKGATKWLSKDRVVIGLNNQHKFADAFWFTLFHELYHVMQQRRNEISIDFDFRGKPNDEEAAADAFARDALIAPSDYVTLRQNWPITYPQLVKFADAIEIDPGIVIGRLQHDHLIPFSQWNQYKTTYEVIHNHGDSNESK